MDAMHWQYWQAAAYNPEENNDSTLCNVLFTTEGIALYYMLTLIAGEFADDRTRWEMFEAADRIAIRVLMDCFAAGSII